MKILSIRCDVCNLELENEGGVFHKVIRIDSFTIGNQTHFVSNKEHYCSVECALEPLRKEIVGIPLAEERLKSFAKKEGYELTKIEDDKKAINLGK